MPFCGQANDVAVIQFSSGSTGNPKGVMLSHANILANLSLKRNFDRTTENDILIHWMPYFHDFGLFGNHLSCVFNAITEIRIDPLTYLRNPVIWLEKITQYKATITSSTSTGMDILLKSLEKGQPVKPIDLSGIKMLSLGAEMIPAGLFDRTCPALSKYGFKSSVFCSGYGMAEATLVVSGTDPGTGYRKIIADRNQLAHGNIVEYSQGEDSSCEIVSVGKPFDGFQIRIANENSQLGTYSVGEIQMKGNCVMSGYYNNPEANQEAFIDGWLRTGDLGFFDKNGYLYIVGRKKEIIIVNGHNYFPYDLESCILSQLNDKIELSLFTSYYSDTEEREIVLHFFVPKNKSEDIRSLANICNALIGRLAGLYPEFSIPIRKGDIPKTSSSKTMRKELANRFLNGWFDKSIHNNIQTNMKNKDAQNINHKQILTDIWKDALQLGREVPELVLTDNFFALGGDSIRTIKAVAEMESLYKRKVEPNFIYKYPTLKEQVDYFQTLDTEIVLPADEYEFLVREIIGEELNIKPSTFGTTDNFISKAKNINEILALIQRIKSIFKLDDIDEKLNEAINIQQIADLIKTRHKSLPAEPFPLMDFQETLYYHSKSFLRNEPTGLSCYIICRTTLTGEFRKEYFDKAFNHVVKSHPILHSVITEEAETPTMITLDNYSDFKSVYTDISSLSKSEQEALFKENDLKDHDHRFDLSNHPLYYSNIFKTGDNEHEIVIHIDHQLIDGFSFFEFIHEALSLYDLFADGKTLEVRVLEGLQFSDYVRIEKFRSETKIYKDAMKFALDVFRNVPEKIAIPMLQNPSMLDTVHFNTLHTEISPEIMQSIAAIAKSTQGISMNSLLLACYFKLMNIWSGQNDLIINMPVYNREQHFSHARKVIGSFLDIFPVRVQTKPSEPILIIAEKIEKFVRTLLEYPVSSIELTRRIAEQEGLKQGSLSSIIFSNSINMIPEGMSKFSKYFRMCAPKVQTGAPGTYIDLVMFTWEGEWHFDWNYVRDLFSESFMKTLSNQYVLMLEQLAQTKDNSVKLAEFTGTDIMPEQYRKLFEQINDTTHEYPVTTINQWIKSIVKTYPQREAVSFEDKSLNYESFYRKANQFAHLLQNLGVKPGEKVALLMNRTLDLPIAQLAILIAGGAYVPIDPLYPAERIKYMLEDCGAKILISQEIHTELIGQTYTEKLKNCILTDVDGPFSHSSCEYIFFTQKDILQQPLTEIESSNTAEDLIYLIYTSGSTGQPKGTMLRHRNVCNFLYYVQQVFDVKVEDRFAFVTSYSFDMTVTSNWLPFLTGASLHILSEEKTRNVELLLRFTGDKAISFLNITPSHFSMLANTLEFTDEQIRLPENMTVMLGAEIINVGDVNKWLSHFPKHKLINEYGPTETTVASTFSPIPVNRCGKCELSIVPIGKPIYNTQVYILNENSEQCMPGVPGILHIGGAGVALGYLNKEERTNSVFISNPATGNKEDIVYNTGDLAKFTETGDIIFIGRKDFQVNVRGYRIELGEIENALSKVPEIAENCADIQFDNNKQAVVVAFYTTKTKTALDDSYILGIIDKLLPQYMLPSSILHVEQIPVTPNGKTDRKSLPYIAGNKQIVHSSSYVPPNSKAEKEMAMIWTRILDIPQIGIHDNFWEIGGDSIKSVRLVRELKAAGFEHVKLRDMFDSPTIFQMINRMGDLNGNENILNLKTEPDAGALLFCFPYAAGTAGMYASLSEDFEQRLKIQSAHYPGHGDNRPLKENIHDLSMLYIKELKENNLPLFLLGYSYGGYVAYDICRKLEKLNIPVCGVIFAGTTPPDIKDELMSFYLSHEADYEKGNRNLFNQEFLDTLSDEEKEEYLKQLKSDTKSMLNYNFSEIRLKTPLLSIIGKDEEAAIKEHQNVWEKYFTHVEYATLPGGHLLIKDFHKELAGCMETFINRRQQSE
jgi:polyketide synthase PksJ